LLKRLVKDLLQLMSRRQRRTERMQRSILRQLTSKPRKESKLLRISLSRMQRKL